MDIASIERSNLPASEKASLIRRWASRHAGGLATAKATLGATGYAVRQGGEAIVTGAVLGYIKAERAEGLDIRKAPIDGIAGAVLVAGSIVLAEHETSTDLLNAGSTAIGICAYRKTEEFFNARKAAGGSAGPAGTPAPGTPAGDFGEDPIVAAARAL